MPLGSIVALGVAPLLSGYVLVEFAALAIPPWRRLRVGGPEGRARLHRAALLTGIVLALFQAIVLTLGLEAHSAFSQPGTGSRLVTVLTLMGATFALVAAARIVDREGLGNGYSILLLMGLVPQIVQPLWTALLRGESGAVPFSVLLSGLLAVGVLAGATLWMFSSFRLPLGDGATHPLLLSRPACGVVPLTLVPAILAAGTAFVARLRSPEASSSFSFSSSGQLPTLLLLNIGAAVFLAYLFNRPDRIAESWGSLSPNPPEGLPRLKAVMLESMFFIVLVTLVHVWTIGHMGTYALDAVGVVLVTAIGCDLWREWRARAGDATLTTIWEIHQTYAVAPAVRLLEANGVRAFIKGSCLRALLQFFGPYVPVRILVPSEQAARAHALLQTRWPIRGE